MNWIFIALFVELVHGAAFCSEDCDPIPTFREVIEKYQNTDKDDVHSYVEPYEKLLHSFSNKPCNLLEIGVNFGGSAIMWHEYLPQSKLFLLDNRNVMMSHITSAMNPSRWHLYVVDAYTPQTVAMMKQECPDGFDLIVDDGPHSLDSQKFVIKSYLPLLNKGGILIIEDIQNIHWIKILKRAVPASPEFEVEIIDLRNIKNRYDDILFVVKRT